MFDDDRLIVAHRSGDPEAFALLVERYRDRLYRLCYRLTFDKEDALDLFQLTIWKAYRGLADYDRQGSLYTWLYRIASNSAIDLLRKARLERAKLERLEGGYRRASSARGWLETEPPLRRDQPDDPARAVLRKELESEVVRAMSRLSPEHRTTLELRAGRGLSYREIADALDCPVGTVMSRLHVARERVRAALTGYLEDEDG
jgi:RNA polymerase sigma-70 factor (ECF subfamily)